MPALLGEFHINLMLAVVTSLFLLMSFEEGLLWLFLSGLLFESFSFNFFGIGLISFLFAGIVVFVTKGFLLAEDKQAQSIYLIFAVAKVVFDFSFWFLEEVFSFFSKVSVEIDFPFSEWGYLWELILFVLISSLVYWIFIKVKYFFKDNSEEVKL